MLLSFKWSWGLLGDFGIDFKQQESAIHAQEHGIWISLVFTMYLNIRDRNVILFGTSTNFVYETKFHGTEIST